MKVFKAVKEKPIFVFAVKTRLHMSNAVHVKYSNPLMADMGITLVLMC